jgi:hypothetical protein
MVRVVDPKINVQLDPDTRAPRTDEFSIVVDREVSRLVVEKRRSHGWQAFGSYTVSRAYGLQPSSGTSAAGAQVSTVPPRSH